MGQRKHSLIWYDINCPVICYTQDVNKKILKTKQQHTPCQYLLITVDALIL